MTGGAADEFRGVPFAREAHQHITLLLGAWMKARHGALVPFRRNLTPDSFASVLPYVWIYRFEEDLGDFVCKISGERINDAWGQSLRGVRFRDVVGKDAHAAALQRWKAVLNTPSIQYGKITGAPPDDGITIAERLVLPLADADGTVCYTIGLSVYPFRQDDRNRTPPVWDDVTIIPCADLV